MAIVKMRRLRLFAMTADRDELMTRLQRLGCVEIDESGERLNDPAWSPLVKRPNDKSLTHLREKRSAVDGALTVLKKYAPTKSSFLSPRPIITEAQLFDQDLLARGLDAARSLNEDARRVSALYAEQSKLKNQIAALAPWLALDLPLETASTKDMAVLFGTLIGSAVRSDVEARLAQATDLASVTWAGADRETQYLVLFFHQDAEQEALDALKEFGFARVSLHEWTGTAMENTLVLEGRLGTLATELETAQAELNTRGTDRQDLTRCLDRLDQEVFREENKLRLLDTMATFFLEGWVPMPELDALESLLRQYPCCWETAAPTPDEYPKVPVKLKNNAITRPLNMVTEMYSLPAYDGLDPNPLMAPFFILFYGIMMADMGYGLLMMIASLVILKKAHPKGGMYHFFALLGLCGISTFIMGAVTGGCFGDFIPQLLKVINPESTFVWFWTPLFTPLDDTLAILIGSMALGAVQILTGMVISFVKQTRDGHFLDALMDIGSWWLVFIGVFLGVLAGFWWVAIAGVAALVLTQGRSSPTLVGKVIGGVGSLYDITGYFGDILSYSRLMALMLAGSVIAQVFNTLGAIPGNVVVFIIISFAGNTLNFALNLLGCYVHDLRLQCLEYFGKFYKDGGKPFRPLENKPKFVDLAN